MIESSAYRKSPAQRVQLSNIICGAEETTNWSELKAHVIVDANDVEIDHTSVFNLQAWLLKSRLREDEVELVGASPRLTAVLHIFKLLKPIMDLKPRTSTAPRSFAVAVGGEFREPCRR